MRGVKTLRCGAKRPVAAFAGTRVDYILLPSFSTHVSLLTLTGRELIPLRFGDYQATRIDRRKGQADLILRAGIFYLYVTIDLPTPPPIKPVGVLGIDLGITEIATDSEGDVLTVYYGASDEVICGATFSIQKILDSLPLE